MKKSEIYERVTKLLDDDANLNVEDAVSSMMSEEELIEENSVSKKEISELIEKTQTCSNFWCKSPFNVKFYKGESFSKICPKCNSFNYELSDGVESGEKHYEGSRQDGLAHEVSFHFSKYEKGKGFWNK